MAMSVCPGTLCGRDIDDLFAYETAKAVRIRDHRLGSCYVIALFGVVVYIGLWSLARNLLYLKFGHPVGPVRFTLQQPTVNGCDPDTRLCQDSLPPSTELPYCCQNKGCKSPSPSFVGGCTCESSPNLTNYNCSFFDGDTVGVSMRSSIFIGTRLRTQVESQNATCVGDAMTSCTKVWIITEAPTDFVAGIENYTLLIDHAAEVPDLEFFAEASDSDGRLQIPGDGPAEQALCARPKSQDANGRPTKKAPCFIEPMHPPHSRLDIITVSMLLTAAGVDLDDARGHRRSARYHGLTMTINIHYYNTKPWRGILSKPGYWYEVHAVKSSSYGMKRVHWGGRPGNRTVIAMHGILLEGNVVGKIGGLDFNNLLLQLSASMALLAAANFVVNNCAKYLLAHRQYYTAAMVDTTADFSEVGPLEAMSENDLKQMCQKRFLASGGSRIDKIHRLLKDGYEQDAVPSPSHGTASEQVPLNQ